MNAVETAEAIVRVVRIVRIVLNAPDAAALARFYVDALGFAREATEPGVALRLGDTVVWIADADGAPYPDDVAGWSPLFQHFAIVVDDMSAAMARLAGVHGWTAISTAGPERLPMSSGGVLAFKFRDPVGHPLELLEPSGARPPAGGPFVRIDHSAISVADLERSVAFYGGLGFAVAHRSHNVGAEQQRLDAIAAADVDVVSLAPRADESPRIELLGYRGAYDRSQVAPAASDAIAATRLVCEVEDRAALEAIASARALDVERDGTVTARDPDGHRLVFTTP